MEKIKVFVAHSTHGGDDGAVYKKISEHYENSNVLKIIDVDNSNEEFVLNKITNNIDDCDLFVADLTSEILINDDNKYSLVNSNVMFEVGYAYAKNKKSIYILNEDKNKIILPSLLSNLNVALYGNDYDMCEITHAIDDKCNDIKKNYTKNHTEKYGTKCPTCLTIVLIPEKELKKITNNFYMCAHCYDKYEETDMFDFLKYLNELSKLFDKKTKLLKPVIDKYLDCGEINFEKIINTEINLVSLCNLFFIFEENNQEFTNEYIIFCAYFLCQICKHRKNKFIQKLICKFENRFANYTTSMLSKNFELILPMFLCLFFFKDEEHEKLKSFEIWEHQFRKHGLYDYRNHVKFIQDMINYHYTFRENKNLIDEHLDIYFSNDTGTHLFNFLDMQFVYTNNDVDIDKLTEKYLNTPTYCPVLFCKKCKDLNEINTSKFCEYTGLLERLKFCQLLSLKNFNNLVGTCHP